MPTLPANGLTPSPGLDRCVQNQHFSKSASSRFNRSILTMDATNYSQDGAESERPTDDNNFDTAAQPGDAAPLVEAASIGQEETPAMPRMGDEIISDIRKRIYYAQPYERFRLTLPDTIRAALSPTNTDNLKEQEIQVENVQSLFKAFLEDKQHLQNVTDDTLRGYRDAWRAFEVYGKHKVSESGLKAFVLKLSIANKKPTGINAYSRSINAFLTWLHENGHTRKRLKIKLQKEPKRVLRTYKTIDAAKLLSFEPEILGDKRMMAMLWVMTDTGMRISEIKALKRKDIDFDDALITVFGKGRKERLVPISTHCRKVLSRWMKEHKHDLVFCNQQGGKLNYNNLRREFMLLLKRVGIEKSEGSFHTFRRLFAKLYAQAGGSLFHLQQTLGHETITMTKRYTQMDTEELSRKHMEASPLKTLMKVANKLNNKGKGGKRGSGTAAPGGGDDSPAKPNNNNGGATAAPEDESGGKGGNSGGAVAGSVDKPKARLIKRKV